MTGHARSLVQQAVWRGLAAILTECKKFVGLAGSFRGDSLRLPIVIWYRQNWPGGAVGRFRAGQPQSSANCSAATRIRNMKR
jgi:hypothetical protein